MYNFWSQNSRSSNCFCNKPFFSNFFPPFYKHWLEEGWKTRKLQQLHCKPTSLQVKMTKLKTSTLSLSLEIIFPTLSLALFAFFSFFPLHLFCLHKKSVKKASHSYSLCFTRLPLMSLPSRIASFRLNTVEWCSLATYCKRSVMTEGQLSFKYSKPSVSITANTPKWQINK